MREGSYVSSDGYLVLAGETMEETAIQPTPSTPMTERAQGKGIDLKLFRKK